MLSAEDHTIASGMGHHYTMSNYGDDDIHVAPGDEGFDCSHGGGEYADFEDLSEGYDKLKT